MRLKKQDSLRLGIFIVVGIVLFIMAIYIIGRERNLFGSNFTVRAVFSNVKGLKAGNNVRFSGIDVGTVSDIYIVSDSSVVVELVIETEARKFIRIDSKATIGTEGLMGNKVVNILPGSSDMPSIKDRGVLETVAAVELDDILVTVKKSSENIALVTENLVDITDKINRGEGMFGKIFSDTTFTKNMDITSNNISKVTRDLAMITAKLNQGEGIVGKMLADSAFSRNLDKSSDQVLRVSNNLAEITRKINQGEGIFSKFFVDTATSAKMLQLTRDLNKTSSNASEISQNLVDITEMISTGHGTINKLLTDSIFADSLQIVISKLNRSLDEVAEAADAVEQSWIIRVFSKKKKKKK
ncbi:MAG: MCE family protein [Bacteroidales bacterium]|nr:MCE family protein [Bacteroidales bacterium]